MIIFYVLADASNRLLMAMTTNTKFEEKNNLAPIIYGLGARRPSMSHTIIHSSRSLLTTTSSTNSLFTTLI